MKQVLPINKFYAGQAPGERTGPLGSFKEGIRLDIFSSVDKASILPAATKASGSTVVDLIKWILPVEDYIYYYGDAGNFYRSDLDGTNWTLLGTLTTSHGNGMAYFKEDDYLYLSKDKSMARYGPIGGTPVLTDDFLASEGGAPTNTHSLLLVLASTQYAYVADNADVSRTGDFTIESNIKLTQLPGTAGSAFVVMGKYNTTDSKRSFQFYIGTDNKMACLYSDNGAGADHLSRSYCDTVFDAGDVGVYMHVAVSVDVSAQAFTFYVNGVAQADTVDLTDAASVHDNNSVFMLGASNTVASPGSHADMLMDDTRLWSDVRTAAEILANKGQVLGGNEAGLVGYWKLDNDYTDSCKSSDLTAVNAPTFSTDVPFSGATARSDTDQANSATGETYTLTTAINEAATHRQEFDPDEDPQKSIEVNIDTIGTGNLTLAVHDSLNREVASKTVANGDLNTGDFEFVFASQWRPILGATYHFHITSTVADGKVVSGTASDLEDCDYTSYFDFLVEDTLYHPISVDPVGSLAIGNNSYLAKWDGLTFIANNITLPLNLKIRTLTHSKEFLGIGTWVGSDIVKGDEGWFFFWDGTEDAYNFGSELGYGGVNAAAVISGRTYLVAGSTSTLYRSLGVEDPTPLFKLPAIGDGKYVEIYPGALDVWDGFLCIGVAGGGDSSTVFRGVWLYGTKYSNYEDALVYSFTCSNNSDEQSTDVTIGAVKGIGRRLFFGWKDGSTYGVDMVLATGNPAATAEYGSLIFDDNRVFKKKKALTLVANHEELSGSAEGVKLRYRLDRATDWENGSVNKAEGDKITELPLALTDKWFELEVGYVLSSSGAKKPKVSALSLEYDDLIEEKKVGK